jgi:drug/metabolite transporter (DMT)-like permease
MNTNRINQTIFLSLLSTLFLSTGLIVNSLNAYHGSSWAWTASLRYLLLIPVLLMMVTLKGNLKSSIRTFKRLYYVFLLWGCIGFGGYYALLSLAITRAPAWIVTAGFMTTIVAGILLSPFIDPSKKTAISSKGLMLSLLLVCSLLLMQFERFLHLGDIKEFWPSLLLSLIAAFLWPLGNRKLLFYLEQHQITLDPMQRVLGMTLGSLPIQLALATYGYLVSGFPSALQIQSSFVAVLFSGVLGTILFFKAMQLAGKRTMLLYTVEAFQVTGVLFTLLGEMVIKGSKWPGVYASIGFAVMFTGLGLFVWLSHKKPEPTKSLPGQSPAFPTLPTGIYQLSSREGLLK